MSPPGAASAADDLVSELLPETFDWQRLVRTYPLPALALAALGGYWLGRTRGGAVVSALGAFAAAAAVRGVNEALGEDVL